ncbi:DUF3563 family protein [Burkholderia ambifaria]|nr:DUF3563 family protein [Burkholderia ambifaria]
MIAYLLMKLSALLERTEFAARDAYLASSADLFELERRIRLLDRLL